MKNVSGGKIIPLCQFGAACWFWMALGLHDLIALVSKLEARRRMDGVINAAVAGTETAQQGGVGGVQVTDGDFSINDNIVVHRG